jgi:type II secretory pathway pseudopilin PulG
MPAVRHRLVGTSVRDRVAARLRREEGFGLVELLIAMLVMALGIMAIVAGFSSGMVALGNASRTSTAGALADRQMEAYRALAYATIRLGTATTDATHNADPAYDPLWSVPTDAACASSTPTCMPVQTQATGLTAPDGRSYRLDTYIAWSCPVGTLTGSAASPACSGGFARPVKQIAVVVRDAATPSKTYVRETSTFDAAT